MSSTHIGRIGQRLRDGLTERAAEAGLKLRQTGPAQMPMVLFEDDPDYRKGFAFCSSCAARRASTFIPSTTCSFAGRIPKGRSNEALKAARVAFVTVAEMRAPA